uniref:Uncharacterized protein n=1 Tax=Rhizophora mucronata TaxID=61149 RepID=A0A2P2QI34_RHIMU
MHKLIVHYMGSHIIESLSLDSALHM